MLTYKTAVRPPEDYGLGRRVISYNITQINEYFDKVKENPNTNEVLFLGYLGEYLTNSMFIDRPNVRLGLELVQIYVLPQDKGNELAAFSNAIPAIVLYIGSIVRRNNLKPHQLRDLLSAYMSHEIVHAIAWTHHRKPPTFKEEQKHRRNEWQKPEELIAHVMNVAAEIARIYAGEENVSQSEIMREIENHRNMKKLNPKQRREFAQRVFQKALEILNFKRDAKESNLW